MSLYTSEVVRLPYPPHSRCYEHSDCRDNAELAMACAMSAEPKPYESWRHGDRVEVFGYRKVEVTHYYRPGETEPSSHGSDHDATVERDETTGRISYRRASHEEHRVFESYKDSVVRLWSDPNGRIMSDVWGTVHHAEVIEASGERISFRIGDCDSRRETGGFADFVDVTPEAWERHRLFTLRQSIVLETEAAERAAIKIAEEKRNAERAAVAPRKGARVRVIGARGKGAPPKGSVGECFWVGTSAYSRHGNTTTTERVGLVIDGVKYFTAASNVVLA